MAVFMDELREKESLLSDEIVTMNRKINANNNFAGTARAFGTSSYNQVGKTELKRAQGNFLLKMALLSCIYRLLLTTKT